MKAKTSKVETDNLCSISLAGQVAPNVYFRSQAAVLKTPKL